LLQNVSERSEQLLSGVRFRDERITADEPLKHVPGDPAGCRVEHREVWPTGSCGLCEIETRFALIKQGNIGEQYIKCLIGP